MKIYTITLLLSHLLRQVYSRLASNLAIDSPEFRIVGGTKSTKDRYPYQVALVENGSQFCGGSLISPTWVLTAAHCFGSVTDVEIGRFDLENDSEVYERIKVQHEIPHPYFDMATLDYDFMLLKLEQPSNYTPVMIDDGGSVNLIYGQDLTVIGWGKTSYSIFSSSSNVLLEVEVDYVPKDMCNRRFNVLGAEITGRMICASRVGKSSCHGDSGGPLIIKGVDGSADIQVGIVSWGVACAKMLLPAVYSRVSEAINFIDYYVIDRELSN